LGIGVGIIAISTASLLVRLAQGAGASSLTIAAMRLTFAALILLPIAWQRSRAEFATLSARDIGAGLLSGAFLGAHFATWISSLQYTSVTSSVVLVTLSPLFVALASLLWLRERLTRLAALGMFCAVVGGILIGVGDAGRAATLSAPNPLLGNVLALVGAICIAPYFLIGRRLRMKLSLLAYISLVYSAAALVLLAAVLLTGSPLVGFSPIAYVWMVLLALLPQLVGHTAFNWSLGYLPATFASVPVLAEPVGSTILAIIVLGERITPIQLVGALIAISGIALMTVGRSQSAQPGA
jgi:drug/metabolite transporter (DMT)-like permease